jgi:hypothetical protein
MNQFSRRTLLSGSAAALASMSMWKMLERRAYAQEGVKRVILWFVPEGCTQQAFWPGSGPGALNINMAASIAGRDIASRGDSINSYRSSDMGTWCLQPLKDHESDITLVSGFRNNGSSQNDDHRNSMDAALAGASNAGASVDQILGDYLKGDAAFASIASTLFGAHAHDGASPEYLCPLRLASGGAGAVTWNPVTTYNQVFPTGIPTPDGSSAEPVVNHSLGSKLALLGSVKQRLDQIRCQGGALAQERMEAYLTSVETIESQTQALIEADQGAPPPSTVDLSFDLPDRWGDTNNGNRYWEKSENFGTLCQIQIDTAIAALALDRTRSAFLQFSSSGNDLGVRSGRYDGNHYRTVVSGLEGNNDLHDHEMGHDQNAEESRNQARVFRWYYEQLAYMVGRLKSIPDGSGTLFDSTLIVACSEFSCYNHRRNDLPFMLLGNPGGAFNKGVYLDANNGGHRNHSDFWLGVCQGMGMGLNSFADSSNPYTDILA